VQGYAVELAKLYYLDDLPERPGKSTEFGRYYNITRTELLEYLSQLPLFPIDGAAHSFFDPGHATKALLVGKVEDLVFAIRQILISGGNSEIADYSHLILLLFLCTCELDKNSYLLIYI
jgi:hypothetical protein